jgi:hypothetical protein
MPQMRRPPTRRPLVRPVAVLDLTEQIVAHGRRRLDLATRVQPGGQLDDVREVVTARRLHALEHVFHVAIAEITHLIR